MCDEYKKSVLQRIKENSDHPVGTESIKYINSLNREEQGEILNSLLEKPVNTESASYSDLDKFNYKRK